MNIKTKILILEHDANDIELILYELEKSGINYESKIVQTEQAFRNALSEFTPAIILSDYSLPLFDGPAAFEIKEKTNTGIPFIIVSGTVGEEKAVELIKNGITDYVLKDKLFTLSPKIIRALKEAEEKKEKTITDEKLYKANNLYAFISQVNQNIVRVKDEATLFRNSCQLAIEFGKFQISWIGLFNTEHKTISLVEQCGIAPENLKFFACSSYQPSGPQDRVLHTGKYFVSNDVQNDPVLQHSKIFTVPLGVNSCIVLPIKKSGNIIGTFNLYSSELNFSGIEEIKLLIEVTDDISFALDLFEKEKKQTATEELILKNEKRFRSLVEQGTDAVAIFSPTSNILYISPSIEKILGYTEQEAMKLDMFSLVHPDDMSGLSKVWEQIMASSGIPIPGYTGRLRHKDGSWRWLEATATNMLHDPSINGIVDNFRDVTERIEAEVQQEFEKNNFAALINNTIDLMWSVDRDFNLITSNIPFEEMSKLNFGKVIAKGENILTVSYTPEMLKHFKDSYERAFAGEAFTEIVHFDFPSEFWTEISYYPIHKRDEIIGTACYSRDITLAKLSEQKLRKSETSLMQSEMRLNEAQAIAHLGNWELNFSTGSGLWSEETCRIYGLSPKENTQTYLTWMSFIHPEDLNYVKDATEKAKKTNNNIILNYRILLKDGIIKHIHSKGKFKFNEGKPTGVYGIVLDVTERKSADQEREKMIDNIVQHSKNLEQFASIVSHNLRAPVANILGLANVLKSDISEVDRERGQQYLFTATRNLDEIVTDLNKIVQVRSKINEYKEVVNFDELVISIKSSIQIILEKERVQIITDFSAIDKITCIKSYLYSIFYNLISNGIKYRQEGKVPIITIKSELTKNKIKIFFKDNGIGIDLVKYGDQLFGLYKRFHLNIEGKGLGLFMVKTQIETLGGTIKLESKPAEGTEFIIELPL